MNGLDIHYLESGYESPNRPLIVLLHGFPELSFSWRFVMKPLADQGFHVVAPDQRGFGKTTGWDNTYTEDLSTYHHINLVRDILGFVNALGYESVECLIGHDSGAGVAGWSSLIRPDVYKSVIMMSAPFGGVQSLPFDTKKSSAKVDFSDSIYDDLAELNRPRKHYQQYYRTLEANKDLMQSSIGLRTFIRSYYFHKSADWPENDPYPLESWSATELSKMPTYYIIDLDDDMAETVAKVTPSQEYIQACTWLSEEDIAVYESEYQRTGFQGGLNWYRASASEENRTKLELFSGMNITIPSLFISGKQDWGSFQRPGTLEKMQKICTKMKPIEFIGGAGHWVQQEQPEKVVTSILNFIKSNS